MTSRVLAFAIWALVLGSLTYWGLRLAVRGPVAPPYTVSAVDAQSMRGDFARVFGAPPAEAAAVAVAAPAAASRFKLVGVAAPQAGRSGAASNVGLALISVDGKNARAYAVGRTVEDGWVLQSVNRRGARLASNLGASTVDLEVPALASAQRGNLPPVSNTIQGLNGRSPSLTAPPAPNLPRTPSAVGVDVNPTLPANLSNDPAANPPGSLPSRAVPAPPPMPRESPNIGG
jgi:general secretion pathway protein C